MNIKPITFRPWTAGVVVATVLISSYSFLRAQSTDDLAVEPLARSSDPRDDTSHQGMMAQSCRVMFISDPILSFEEPGVITKIPSEGETVKADDVIAKLNDEEVKLRILTAEYAFRAAKKESENRIKVQYAEKQAEASEADYLAGVEANRKVPDVVTEMEMRRRKLEWEAGVLGAANAKIEIQVSTLNALAKQAELRTAQALEKRISLKSPFTGVVVEKIRDVGEYVKPGDPCVRVGQLDKIRVEGRLNSKDLAPGTAVGRSVSVRIDCGRGANNQVRIEEFRSIIGHVGAEIDLEGMYFVWAEIENTSDFAVRPGFEAQMILLP